jgi:putative transposase
LRFAGAKLHLEEPTMPRKRYTEEQIVSILSEATAGAKTIDICRKYGVSENTFFRWRSKYAGMTVPDIKKMRALEDENSRLKRKLAETILDLDTVKALLQKNF